MYGDTGKKRLRYDASDYRGDDSDLNILQRMLDGLGVENARTAAIRMLERFGSFGGVFAATEAELQDTGLSSRAAAFFTFVNPALRRIKTGDKPNEKIVDERSAVSGALALFGRRVKHGDHAIYLDNNGRKICSEFLGADSPLSLAAVGACRHRTGKLLIVNIEPDGEVRELGSARAFELSELMRLLKILEIEFVDYIETDGAEFFSLRRASVRDNGISGVFDTDETPFGDVDFPSVLERFIAGGGAAAKRRKEPSTL